MKDFGLRWAWRPTAAATLALALAVPVAHAQQNQINNGVSIGPSEALSPPTATPPPPPQHLLSFLDGYRADLARVGITLQLDWISEDVGNPYGGLKQGFDYAGQVGFEADIDWNKLAGVRGFSTHVVLVNREGSNLGSQLGDNLNQVQEIYGAGGDTVVHLVYAYAEETLFNGRLDVIVGREPVDNDFAASPIYCNFMSNTICGNPRALVVSDIGMSSYPDGVWGTRARLRPTADTYIQAGVYEVNQGLYGNANFRSGFKFDDSQDSGVIFPVEFAYEPTIGSQAMPGHYKLGFAYDTSIYPQFLSTAYAVQTGNTNTGTKTNFWALFDQMVVRNGPGQLDGVVVFGGYAHEDPSLSNYDNQAFVGVIDNAFWAARPQDSIGLLFSYGTISGNLARQQELDIQLGQPIAGAATGVQNHEEVVEAHYDIHVYNGVDFQPTFQYYLRPNAQANIKDAAIFGFKTHVSF